jgi:hypothetical protein
MRKRVHGGGSLLLERPMHCDLWERTHDLRNELCECELRSIALRQLRDGLCIRASL